jgi:excinuclease ABC subunit C
MKRRVSESLLDDCPGVSSSRKAALLRKFGSVSRIRRTPATEIASIPGIGPKLAESIINFLRERAEK